MKRRRGCRLSLADYDTARHLEEVLSRELPDEAREMFTGMLNTLAAHVGLTLAHPSIVRAVFIELRHLIAEAHGTAQDREITMLRLELGSWARTWAHEEPVTPEDSLAAGGKVNHAALFIAPDKMDSSAPAADVVDLAGWLSSHPRPIRNLIFAEKGGDAA